MTRRFGRNQRRRAREAVAALEQQVQEQWGSVASYRNQAHAAREEAYEAERYTAMVAEQVGRFAIIAGAEPIHAGMQGLMRREKFSLNPRRAPSFVSGGAVLGRMAMPEVMEMLDVEIVQNHFAAQMHALVSLGGAETGYAISESALRNMDVRMLEEVIAPQIARELASKLVGRRR